MIPGYFLQLHKTIPNNRNRIPMLLPLPPAKALILIRLLTLRLCDTRFVIGGHAGLVGVLLEGGVASF